MEQDTGALPAPEDEADLGEDDAEWSRAWEWPEWVRNAGGGIRGWRPDGRTLVAVLALVEATTIASLIPGLQDLWRAAFPPPAQDQFGQFGIIQSSRFAWERWIAGGELLTMLAAVLVVAGAVVVALVPRRLPGYVVVLAGLSVRLVAALAITVAEFHLNIPLSFRSGYIATVLLTLALIALVVLTAVRRPRPAAAD